MNPAAKLHTLYESLLRHHGTQHWWPAETPFEVMVGAILTQNTSWTNVERALAGLRAVAPLTPEGILALGPDQLETAIRSSGYFRQKTARLGRFCAWLMERHRGRPGNMAVEPTDGLRRELLDLPGIGPETADCILLYALGRPVFVVDAYTLRILSRLGLVEQGARYDAVQNLFMDNLDPDPALFNEFHALFVVHGKTVCRKREPRCGVCVLSGGCGFGPRPGVLGGSQP